MKKPPLVIDVDDPLYTGPGERLGEIEYEEFIAGGDPDFAGQPVDRREQRDRAQLHLGHHRQSEGRGLSPPRHVPGSGRQHHGVAAAAEAGLSVDAADVPLQRLVLPVVGHRDGRHACLPAPGRSGADLPDDRRARRDAHVRRADRAQHAGQRAGRAAPPLQPHRRHPDRRLAAARQGDQGHGGARLPRDAHLRHDRAARPVDAVRAAGRLGRPAARGARRVQRAPGRALSGGRRADGGRPEDARAGRAQRRSRSARSWCAATP